MVFSSLLFIYAFLPLTLGLYFLSPRRFKNMVLLAASLFFYAWGEPVYIILMIFSSIVDYVHGLLIEKNRHNQRKAKLVVLSSVIINLSLLSFFKYYGFFIDNINLLLGTNFIAHELPLPIGISFYTFQTMSYTIDVYRKEAPVQKSPLALATYVTLFPQLIAGPIVRYQTVANEINHREESIDKFAEGLKKFIVGLGKKVLLANNIGVLWSEIQNTGLNDLTVLTAWLGILAFAFQIYFDFSGYSDMAIGLGKIFGFTFLENFNYPYISKSITEFWRRWHISLGTWFRDYLYIPLGGNRIGKQRMYINLFIVWFATGFWHGASWNFILWGIYYGFWIALEKAFLLNRLKRVWKPIQHLYVMIIVIFGWVLFAFDDLSLGFDYMKTMLGFHNASFYNTKTLFYLYNYSITFVFLILGSTPIIKGWALKLLSDSQEGKYSHIKGIIETLVLIGILMICTAYLVDDAYNPFLYFRF